jgi:tetratricopeptide (TPR) repeat protein
MSILARRSGGNPLFLQELLSATRVAGTTEGLPDTVEAMVTAQIDQLASDDRRLLRVASVLGLRFRARLVEELLDGTVTGPSAWRRLSEFVTQDGTGFYRFRHALMRDAAYEGLAYRRRRDLHFRAGETIERERATDDADLDLLALHFFYGGVHDKAWLYSQRAGEAAEAKFAIVEAAEHLERALQSRRQVPSVDATTSAALYEKLGDLRERIGQYPQAASAYTTSRRLLQSDPESLGRLFYKHATVAERAGNYAQALRWLRRGMDQLESTAGGSEAQQYARLMAFYGLIRHVQGRRFDAERWLRRAIDAAQQSNALEALAHAYFSLDWVLVEVGRSDEAVYSQRALDIYDELGIIGTPATIYNNLGMFAWLEGRWDEAVELYERGRDLHRRIGAEVDAAVQIHNIAEVLSDQGHLDEARSLFEESLRVWRAADYRVGVAYATSSLGRVASRGGDFPRADELYAAAREQFHRGAGEAELVDTDARIAEALVLQGRCEDAVELASACLQRTAVGGGASQDPLLHRVRGYAHFQRGDGDSALADFEESLRRARERHARYEVALTLDAIARAAERRGARDLASRREADELFASLGVVFVPTVPLERDQSVVA